MKGQITHNDKCGIAYTLIDHSDQGESLPGKNECVSWWFNGPGRPPYVGTMMDDKFPGIDYFFCWSYIHWVPDDFFTTHNPEW